MTKLSDNIKFKTYFENLKEDDEYKIFFTEEIKKHPENLCVEPPDDCNICTVIVCKNYDLMHFHHDGCPSCIVEEQNLKKYVTNN